MHRGCPDHRSPLLDHRHDRENGAEPVLAIPLVRHWRRTTKDARTGLWICKIKFSLDSHEARMFHHMSEILPGAGDPGAGRLLVFLRAAGRVAAADPGCRRARNDDSPIAVDFVAVKDAELFKELAGLPASQWFANREQYRRDYRQFAVWSLELVPGQFIESSPSRGDRAAGLWSLPAIHTRRAPLAPRPAAARLAASGYPGNATGQRSRRALAKAATVVHDNVGRRRGVV